MELTGILVKTPKGVEEIQTRADRLAQKKRNVLILVDGNTSVENLVARFPGLGDVRQTLQELVEGGYAEIRKTTVAVAAPVAAAPTVAVADAANFDEAVRALSRNLHDLVGPAADDFTGRLEGARDRARFLQATQSSVKMVESFGEKKKVELFQERAMAIADRFFNE